MVLLNNATEWKKVKSEIEKDLSDMGEYGRVIRCHRDPYGKFHGASIECGLNISYKIDTKEIVIWGVGHRYSNGYITYEKLVEKIEMFKRHMEKVII